MYKIDFQITGADRKKLVQTISQATGYKSEYLKAPTMAYQVGPYFVSRTGAVEVNENEPTLHKALDAALAAGFTGSVESTAEPEAEDDKAFIGSITVSKEGMTPAMVENLQKIILGKAALIRQAFDVDSLPVVEEEDRITFHWFKAMNPESAPAFCEFAAALVKMAREAKRVTMTGKPVENPKYAWRCFLLRLGMIGPEYKETRKILMKNFSGSSAFKTGKDAKNEQSQ